MKNKDPLKISKNLLLPIKIIDWKLNNNSSQLDKMIANKNYLLKSKYYNVNGFFLLGLWYLMKNEFFKSKKWSQFYLTRKIFIIYWIKLWYKKLYLKNIWNRWFFHNQPFLIANKLIKDENSDKLFLFSKNTNHSFIKIDKKILLYCFKSISNFNQTISGLFATLPSVIVKNKNYIHYNNCDKKSSYEKTLAWNIKGKTLATIWLSTWSTKTTAFNRLKKLKKNLKLVYSKNIFNIKHRYKKIWGNIAQLSNLYTFFWTKKIRNKYYKNSLSKSKCSKNKFLYVNNINVQKIRSKKIYCWFDSKKEKINAIIRSCNYKIFKIKENIENNIIGFSYDNYQSLKDWYIKFKDNALNQLQYSKINWMPKENYIYYNNWFS